MSALGNALVLVPGIGLLAAALWVWSWDPHPGSGLTLFPAAHLPGYSKGLSLMLGALGLGWLVYAGLRLL